MTNEIKIGFSMHPRWVEKSGLQGFIDPLREAGLSALEFELDDYLDCWADSLLLMDEAVEKGLKLSFHAPYRAPHSLVGFAGDQYAPLVQEYLPLLKIADDWGKRLGEKCPLVVHAAVAAPPVDPALLVADTVRYLNWIADTFPYVHLALENNHPPFKNEIKVGIEREDIFYCSRAFRTGSEGLDL